MAFDSSSFLWVSACRWYLVTCPHANPAVARKTVFAGTRGLKCRDQAPVVHWLGRASYKDVKEVQSLSGVQVDNLIANMLEYFIAGWTGVRPQHGLISRTTRVQIPSPLLGFLWPTRRLLVKKPRCPTGVEATYLPSKQVSRWQNPRGAQGMRLPSPNLKYGYAAYVFLV